MSRMKTFLKYVIWLVLFFIISEFLIAVSLNASYRDIERRDDLSQVQISQAQATLVNGRVKGTITNTQELGGTYVRFDFYSERDNVVGRKYIQLEKSVPNQDFSIYLDAEDITSYEVSVTNEIQDDELNIIEYEPTSPEIIVATIITLLIFWG